MISIIPELAHEDLAEMTGCSRTMVSRLLAEMAENELLIRRGKQYLLLNKWQSRARQALPQVKTDINGDNSKTTRLPPVSRLEAPRTAYNGRLRSVRGALLQ
ncbi:MAG: helix-turn-helix domain-containing protein [Candidatus Binatus sp.]